MRNLLENIISNFEDLEDAPPKYEEIFPTREEGNYNSFPYIKIKLSDDLNSVEGLIKVVSEGRSSINKAKLHHAGIDIVDQLKKFTNNNEKEKNKKELKQINGKNY